MIEINSTNKFFVYLYLYIVLRKSGPDCVAHDTEFNDNSNNDCDWLVDEELYDGMDNDGDGRIDEDIAANYLYPVMDISKPLVLGYNKYIYKQVSLRLRSRFDIMM